MVFNNHASNQGNNRNNSSNQNNKAHKEEMSLQWTSMTAFRSDDKNNPAEAGFFITVVYLLECNWFQKLQQPSL